jgi:hypothetical protein
MAVRGQAGGVVLRLEVHRALHNDPFDVSGVQR